MGEHVTTTIMSDATRAMAAVFGRLLAEDIEAAKQVLAADGQESDSWLAHYINEGNAALECLGRLDVGPDEDEDRDQMQLLLSGGEVWLRVAESGRLNPEYVCHVLGHLNRGGYVGPPWVRAMLSAIQQADKDVLDQLALSVPEYVGLWRSYREVPDAVQRMQRVVGG